MKPAALLTLAALALAAPAAAREQVPAEHRTIPWDGTREEIPGCRAPEVLERIAQQFRIRESEYWSSSLRLVVMDNIRAIAFRPNGLDYIPRRYCTARGHFTDGRQRGVVYSVVEGGGFAGALDGVQWCVQGLDRHMAFAPHCRAARP